MWIVYSIVNRVNSKAYYGQTSLPLAERWCSTLTNDPNPHLKASVAKYGANNFTRQVVAYASCQQDADLLEKFYIQAFQTTDRRYGYNFQSGGKRGPGRHIGDVKESIARTIKQQWENRTEKERWEFAFNRKLQWLSRTERERREISRKLSKAKSAQHKQRISEALKMYFARKRELPLPPKKPPVGVKSPGKLGTQRNREETRAASVLKEVQQAERQLREIKGRLASLRFELEGGCTW